MKKQFYLTILLVLCFALPAMAKTETQSIYSPNCNASQLEEIGKKGKAKIALGPMKDSYNVTLDTKKMTWAEFTKKMNEAKCF